MTHRGIAGFGHAVLLFFAAGSVFVVGLASTPSASAHSTSKEALGAIDLKLADGLAATKLTPGTKVRHTHCRSKRSSKCRWRGKARSGGWTYVVKGRAKRLKGAKQLRKLKGPKRSEKAAAGWQVKLGRVRAPKLAPLRAPRPVTLGINENWAGYSGYTEWAQNVGAKILRFPLGWNVVEEKRGTYDWTYYDELYEQARARGLQLILTPQDSPCWARAALGCPGEEGGHPPDAEHLDEFGDFLAAAVRRYDSVVGVEVWNEPNLVPYYLPGPEPEHYARILEAGYDAVQQARPELPVVFAGLAPIQRGKPGESMGYMEFLARAHDAGAGEHYDALAFHPYVVPFDRPDYQERLRKMIAELKGELVRIGHPDRDLWMTEFGFSTDGPSRFNPVSPEEQAVRTATAYRTFARIPGVPVAIVHRLFDAGGPESPEAGWGLAESDHETPKPAYCMLAAQTGASCETPEPPAEPPTLLDQLPFFRG